MGPLSHIKVLDLSRVMAGPWAGQVLADLGGEVIKVERPGAGDDTRGWGPPFLKAKDGSQTRESGYYLATNRGKRSVTIALNTPEGQELVRKLAAQSDIVLENFKVGTLARYNLAYEDLKAVNERLIYCSITGFGQDGPRADQVAYDFMIQAMGGLMSITGEQAGKPGGGPQKVGIPIVDLITGLYGVIAVLAALAHREETGKGDYIDLSMLDVQAHMLANQAMNYLLTGNTPRSYGNAHPNIMPQDAFQCRDGAMVLAVGNDVQFQRFCDALGRDDWKADPRFEKNAGRVEHRDELLGMIAEEFARYDRADLLDRLRKQGVPSGPINTVPEVFAEPQIEHRRLRRDIPHPLSGTVPQVASPLKFESASLEYETPPPLLGQHTEDVLAELGLSRNEIEELAAKGIV
ncbi:MAG TPA: CaiB/BaiF CoA-transferase family protein [Hyphomicrobiales bacterium]|nr:CaiB/BaiF CoA-transferase family protein [Hyphomicrobiales bacterium]